MTAEILFYYKSMQNPNGYPEFENQLRLIADDTIVVTDVRIKRTIRDYELHKKNFDNQKDLISFVKTLPKNSKVSRMWRFGQNN